MDEDDSILFRQQLLDVAEGLGREEVEALKFLCKDFIPFRRLEEMTSARELFQSLISKSIVNQEDPFFIAELLYRIQHNSLLPKLDYTIEKVQANLPQKGMVSEYRQMLYELSEQLTEDDLTSARFLLMNCLPKKQSKMSGLQLLSALEKNDLISKDNLQKLEDLCAKISPDLLRIINTYRLKKVSVSVQESKATIPSSACEFREISSERSSLSPAIQESPTSRPTKDLDSFSTLRENVGVTHGFGSNQGVKVGNLTDRLPTQHEQNVGSKTAAEMSSRYKMDRPCRGYCLIFNNMDFGGHLGERKGSQKDAEELERVFTWLGLKVIMYNDQTSTEMRQHLQEWQDCENWKECDCLVCCILSHGKSGEIYGTDAKLISIRTIMYYFTAKQCPRLAQKPKLFFIQACQGEKTQKPVYLEGDNHEPLATDARSSGPLPLQLMPSIPEEADFLLGMATVDGYLSFRHPLEGTWYIQALCTKLQLLVPKGEDILSILTEVNEDVSARADSKGLRKQMPQPAYTLRKKLIFPVPRDQPPSQLQ